MVDRDELDEWFAQAEDVLTDWNPIPLLHVTDAASWSPPRWDGNFDCPPLRHASTTAVLAAHYGLDGAAARAYESYLARRALQNLRRGFDAIAESAIRWSAAFSMTMTQAAAVWRHAERPPRLP